MPPCIFIKQMAKQHLTEEFIVVGIQEMFDQSLKVMQALLPDYFPAKTELFKSKGTSYSKYIRNPNTFVIGWYIISKF